MRLFQKICLFTVLAISLPLGAMGRSSTKHTLVDHDSALIEYSLFDFINQIIKYHPLIKSAGLEQDIGRISILKARGNFDPQIQFNQLQKSYNGTQYFNLQNLQINNSTRVGAKFIGGTEYATGNYVDPMNYVGTNGLNYIGAELPLLRDLMIDKKRADLQKSRIYAQTSIAERIILENQIIYSAIDLYTDWLLNYESAKCVSEIVANAEKRKNALLMLYNHGAATSIDTLETHVQLNQYKAKLTELNWKIKKSQILLNSFLWIDNFYPVELDTMVIPTFNNLDIIDSLVINWKRETNWQYQDEFHTFRTPPSLVYYQNKVLINEIQKKLTQNNLLPELSIKYQYLQPLNEMNFNKFNFNNNKFGIQFSAPLIRSSIADYKIAQFQKQQSELEFLSKRRELIQKSNAYFQEIEIAKKLQKQWYSIASETQLLYQMEMKRLEAGDVNFFIINTRETRALDQKLKSIEAQIVTYKRSNDLLSLLGYN